MIRTGNVYIGSLAELPNPSSVDLKPGIIFLDESSANKGLILKQDANGTKVWISLDDLSEYSF